MLYLFVNFEIGKSFQKLLIRIQKCDAADEDIKENDNVDKDMIPLGLPCFAGDTQTNIGRLRLRANVNSPIIGALGSSIILLVRPYLSPGFLLDGECFSAVIIHGI